MKKVLIFMMMFCSCAYGAVSDDVYVRQDVFDAKMETLFNKIHADIADLRVEIKTDIKELNGRIDALSGRVDALSGRVDGLNGRIDGLNYKTDVLQTVVYWGLAILALLVAFAIFAPSFGEFLRSLRKPSFTLDDVKNLIAEAKLQKAL
ncbi:MAG: hypothetical protein IJU31_06915 [Synergistaceae bacterium]|nr:hypothetical protein [Synergistaceae bacterium]